MSNFCLLPHPFLSMVPLIDRSYSDLSILSGSAHTINHSLCHCRQWNCLALRGGASSMPKQSFKRWLIEPPGQVKRHIVQTGTSRPYARFSVCRLNYFYRLFPTYPLSNKYAFSWPASNCTQHTAPFQSRSRCKSIDRLQLYLSPFTVIPLLPFDGNSSVIWRMTVGRLDSGV